jgi:hypothetical protein
MLNQNSFDDDDNAGNSDHLEELEQLRDVLEDTEQRFGGVWREDLELRASGEHQVATRGGPDLMQLINEALAIQVQLHDALEQAGLSFDDLTSTEQQGGNVEFISEEDHAAKSEGQDFTPPTSVDQQNGNVKFLPEEDDVAMRRRLEPDPVQPADEMLASPFQPSIDYLRRAGMSVAEVEVDEMLEQERKGGIAPNPNTPMETKVHTERMKKKRPFGIKYKKKKEKSEPSQEAQEVCQSTVCCDRRWNCVSLFVFFSRSQDIVIEAAKRWKDGDGKGGSGGGAPLAT